MRVRNFTGIKQREPSGAVLHPASLDEWTDVPYDAALKFWRLRVADMDDSQSPDRWWKESDGTHIFWSSPFSLGDGYATAAESMVLALNKLGLKLHLAQTWFGEMHGLHSQIAEGLQTPHPAPMQVGICMATAGEFSKLPTPYKIGLTMYEADNPLENLPEWRHECRILDMLIVPCEHSKKVFGKFVTHCPINVVPLAVNPLYYTAKKRKPKDTFTFGIHGTLTSRKSPIELIEAFTKAFPTEQDVRLELKTRLGIMGVRRNYIPPIADPRVTIINEDWLAPKMLEWLEGLDAYVFPSKGEGFAMTPREAMATGCPTILSNHTGMADVCDEQYNWPIPVASEEESPLGGIWRLPDWDYVIETMRWMYHNRKEAYKKARKGAKWLIKNHGAEAAATQLKAIIEEIEPLEKNAAKRVPAETIGNCEEKHAKFYEAIQKLVPVRGRILDIGVGEGVLYAELVKRGYAVTGIVEPNKLEHITKLLEAQGITPNLIPRKLFDLRKMRAEFEACVSQGVLQNYRRTEIHLILKACLRLSPVIMFSVPTVHYPGDFGPHSRLLRRGRWEDMVAAFSYEFHYYGARQYLWCQIHGLDAGQRAPAYGYMVDNVWHPHPWQRDDGKVVSAEQI